MDVALRIPRRQRSSEASLGYRTLRVVGKSALKFVRGGCVLRVVLKACD